MKGFAVILPVCREMQAETSLSQTAPTASFQTSLLSARAPIVQSGYEEVQLPHSRVHSRLFVLGRAVRWNALRCRMIEDLRECVEAFRVRCVGCTGRVCLDGRSHRVQLRQVFLVVVRVLRA